MDGGADSHADDDSDTGINAVAALRAEVTALRSRLAERDDRIFEFVARLAHELRTPLGAILMWAHVLRLGRDADREAAIDAIESSAHAESKIIGRLLDFSRAFAGLLKINHAILDLREPVSAALEEHRIDAHAHGIALEVTVGDEPLSVIGDGDRIREIVSNLVSNGIKCSPPNGTLRVLLSRVDQHARITVSDTGGGFERAQLPHVFTVFRGGGDAEIRARGGGLGLGLALARALTALHGGTLCVDSEGKGKGATFSVDLPLIAA